MFTKLLRVTLSKGGKTEGTFAFLVGQYVQFTLLTSAYCDGKETGRN